MLNKLLLSLLAAFSLGTIFAVQVEGQACDQPRVRKEIRELSTEEWNAYIGAVKKLHSGPAPTAYDKIVAIHLRNVPQAHNVPCFFPWHRKYIREFELALQSIDSSITLPYWDWSLDSQAPETSLIFTPEYYGSSGESPCIEEGHFKGWQMSVPKPHCLKRQWNRGKKISALYPPELLSKIITGAKSYNEFRVAIEAAPHALVHVNIGGETGDIGTMWSPNDPLFWSHHAFVDKIWADFQFLNPVLAHDYGGFNSNNVSVSADEEVIPFGITVASTFDTSSPEFCYSYSNT
ncbi:Di-copper centre-containing protein, partial [Basidiobolus meristosporus CBS 931.73]